MDKAQVLAAYMELTQGDRKRLEEAKALIDVALSAKAGDLAAGKLQDAEDLLRRVSRAQFWRVL